MKCSINVAVLLGATIALVGYVGPSAAACSNGIDGIESTSNDICCHVECSMCGGGNCANQNTTNGAADCCISEIQASGVYCDQSGAAPCIISPVMASNDSVCDNGMTGVQDPDTDVCCPLTCGDSCGGDGCGKITGVSASDCCAETILKSGRTCDNTGEPPCFVTAVANDTTAMCSNGYSGVEDTVAGVCCVQACGQCGGVGCGDIPGLSASDCCSATIETTGVQCNTVGVAPCIMSPPDYSPSTCPNGLAGVADASVCCSEECGQCGGSGCGSITGTGGPSSCCAATILASGVSCDQTGQAPCIMSPGSYTPAPVVPGQPQATVAPIATPGTMFSAAPTVVGQTASPAVDTIAPSMGTLAPGATLSPSLEPADGSRGGLGSVAPTGAPAEDTAGASGTSAGRVVTVAALAGGAFAMFAASHN